MAADTVEQRLEAIEIVLRGLGNVCHDAVGEEVFVRTMHAAMVNRPRELQIRVEKILPVLRVGGKR